MARPVWYKVTLVWDAIFFGPFYFFAFYAFYKGRDWIRIPVIIYSSVLLTILSVIMSEEIYGPVPAINLPFVSALNAPWILVPLTLLIRMVLNPHPFTTTSTVTKKKQ